MARVLRTRCTQCGTKWFFEEHHLARLDVDPDVCANCGGETVVIGCPEGAGADERGD